ncbi:MAG: hypothetical protein LAT82_02785 [Nanoarchaeota archaeon]|nr:hypothetical protein [Nanoarchaeota archaeon]
MNASFLEISKYSGLEEVLDSLTQKRKNFQDFNYSTQFSTLQINTIRDNVLRAHDKELRKSGGYYIEKHLVPMAKKGLELGLVPSFVSGILVHDTVEDTDKDNYSLKTPTLGDRNLRILRESLQRADFRKIDRRLIVAMCGILTKLSTDQIQDKYGPGLNEDELSEMKFHAKIERALGKSDWLNDSFFSNNVGVSHRFGAQICGLLDIEDNLDIFEEIDISKYDKSIVRRFEENKSRNLKRALTYGMELDLSIRKLSNRGDCIIDEEAYNKYIEQTYSQKLRQGLEHISTENLGISFNVYKYWGL